MESTCEKCGVAVCKKNQYSKKSKRQCKSCYYNNNYCVLKYEDENLNKLSIVNGNKITEQLKQKRFYLENKDSESYKARKRKNFKDWYDNEENKDKHKVKTKKYLKCSMENITDNYVKKVIVNNDKDMSRKDVSQELITIKRKQLKIYRYVCKRKKDTNS